MERIDYRQNVIFIENTIRALTQYEKHSEDFEKSYAHTLFINACVGLLMVPVDSVLGELPLYEVNKDDWGIDPADISQMRGSETKSVREVARRLRHAIAHNNFQFGYDEVNPIPLENLHFENHREEFTADLSFYAFKQFVLKVAKEAVKILQRKIDSPEY